MIEELLKTGKTQDNRVYLLDKKYNPKHDVLKLTLLVTDEVDKHELQEDVKRYFREHRGIKLNKVKIKTIVGVRLS